MLHSDHFRRLLSAVLAGFGLSTVNLLCPLPLKAQTSSPAEEGKQIYITGESPSRAPLEAVLGEGSTIVPGSLMPCVGCHGADGKGRPEGGVTPSDITWRTLTLPLRNDGPLTRQRPAYSVESLRKAMREGMDPAGNELGATMPRYRISDPDLNSLVAYMKGLGAASDPGLTADAIRVGAVVPASGLMAPAGESITALLRAYFSEMNNQGGIYGRKVELEILRSGGTQAEMAAQVNEFVRSQQVFAMVGILAPGAERDVNASLERAGVPAIDAFATQADGGPAAKSRIFHVLSGLPQQASVLVKYAQERQANSNHRTAVVYPQDRKSLADAVIEACRTRACAPAALAGYTSFDADNLAASLSAQKIGTVFFLGGGRELEELLVAALRSDWRPTVFQPGPLAGEEVFHIAPEFSNRVFFSFPTLPTDIEPLALEEYAFLARKYKLASIPPLRALSALAPAKVFVEALRQAGRELNRDKLVETLSGIYDFTTGWTPPVTYGATRRVGALGAYVVRLNLKDKSFAPVEPWMAP